MAPNPPSPQPESISPDDLRECLEQGGGVAVVTVLSAEVLLAGTRSERVEIDASVETPLGGNLPPKIRMKRFTHGGDTVLAPRKRYVVAVLPADQVPTSWTLVSFAAVAEGDAEKSAEAHRAAIRDLGLPPR